MKNIKIKFKKTILMAAMFASASVSALEVNQENDSIWFSNLDSSLYQLQVKAPDGEIRTFTIKDGEFALTAKSLGLPELEDGQYKYQLTPISPSNILAKQVRNLGDKQVSKDYSDAFKSNAKPYFGVFSITDNVITNNKSNNPVDDRDSQTRDQVILDDLIVDGSGCFGFDCVNGESFGFDTIRLKENNLRIRFQDTSASASFPSNDWQITINDSSNGGANKFSIDDIDGGRTPFTIEAGSPSNSLYVDDGGKVGFGTSTPVVDLHVKKGNTPTLRLEQDGTAGFTPQTWDVAGNEANFFIRDASNGSTLPFRIYPGAPSNSLTIEASTGDIGIGTASPDAELEIENNTGVKLNLKHTGTNASTWTFRNNQDTGRLTISDDLTRVPFKLFQGAVNNLLKIGSVNSSTVQINGDLDVQGNITATGTITPDYVFEKSYQMKSIEDHAKSMWKNKHLPMVAAAKINKDGKGVFSINQRSQQLLEELEIAHIYIQQLNTALNEVTIRLNRLEKQNK